MRRLIEALERGVETQKGEVLHAKRVSMLRAGEKNSWLDMILDEGKNRQIRRMLELEASKCCGWCGLRLALCSSEICPKARSAPYAPRRRRRSTAPWSSSRSPNREQQRFEEWLHAKPDSSLGKASSDGVKRSSYLRT